MINKLYTIGYSGFTIDDFVDTLNFNGINAVIDVRSSPYSSYFQEYNKEPLERTLKFNRIAYRNYAEEFGARQLNRKFHSPEGYLDFELFTKSGIFMYGYKKIVDGMKKDYSFTLMCSEKNPMDCHRAIMVARVFHDSGYDVVHLLPEAITVTQETIEEQMLDVYFSDRKQISLFGEIESDNELIKKAYRQRNAEIGYYADEQLKVV
jgi:uncharacterized protein (DUF488 family)